MRNDNGEFLINQNLMPEKMEQTDNELVLDAKYIGMIY